MWSVKATVPGSGGPLKPRRWGGWQSLPSVHCGDENSPSSCPAGLSSAIPQCLPSSRVSCQQLSQRHPQTADLWVPCPLCLWLYSALRQAGSF